MRIAYFTNQYPAVSHTFIRREIAALEQLGITVIRYALRSQAKNLVDVADQKEEKKTHYILRAGAVEISRCFVFALLKQPFILAKVFCLACKIGWRSDRGLLRHIAYAVEATVLAGWCRRDDIQHIHVHFGTNPAAVAMLASQLCRLPYSFTAHGPDEFERASLLSLDEKLSRAAFAICVSSFGKSQLMRWSSADQWAKIEVVHCGIDNSFLENEVPAVSTNQRFVCVGRLVEPKAQLLLIKAVRVLQQAGIFCELVLVGDGPMRINIENAIREAHLENQITLTGWAAGERVKAEILSSRAMVLASFSENMPVVIMEAMALGRPVISTYIAGIPELVHPGRTGWLVPASDENALAEAMRQALTASRVELEHMGQEARRHVADHHDSLKEAAKLKKLFERSIDHGHGRPSEPGV
jgi:glycosyltransferase involved in cell wall biosynthesis